MRRYKRQRSRGHKRSSVAQRVMKVRFRHIMSQARIVGDFVAFTHEPARYAFFRLHHQVLVNRFSLILLCWLIREMPQSHQRDRLCHYRDQIILERRTLR